MNVRAPAVAGGVATGAARRDEVVSLGLKSIVSETLTTCLLGVIDAEVGRPPLAGSQGDLYLKPTTVGYERVR